jgi:hypothetical protein
MRWTLPIALSVLLLAAPSGAGLHETSATATIRLTASAAGSKFLVDQPPKGYPNKGDVLRETATLRNAAVQFGRPKGAIIGSDVWITTIVIPPFGKIHVRGTTSVPGGTIRAVGTVTVTQTSGTFRVVGGTGKYAGARGTIGMRNLNASGSRGLSVFRLQLP